MDTLKAYLKGAPGLGFSGEADACTQQDDSSTSTKASSSVMSTPRTAAINSVRGGGAQHQASHSKIEQCHESFEDELAAPSSLRQIQDERGMTEDNTSYRDTRSRKRRSRRSINAVQKKLLFGATPNKLCHCLLVAILVQVLVVSVLLIIYILLSNGSKSQNQNSNTTVSPVYYSNPIVESIYLAPPPEDIHHLCNMDKIITPAGRQACQEVCSRATCCSLAYMDVRSCWNNNVDACQAYGEACAVLEPLQPTSSKGQDNPQKEHSTTVMPNALVLWGNANLLKPAPEQLSGFCLATAFWGDDMMNSEEVAGAAMTCHEICNSARCCWDRSLTNAADRCWTHPRCRPYEEACSSSTFESQTTPSAPSSIVSILAGRPVLQEAPWNITNYCQPDRIQTSVHELLACQEMCLPVECCWNSASRDDCTAFSSTDKCDAYKSACGVLIGLVEPRSSETTTQGLLTVAPSISTEAITSENTNAEPATYEPPQQGYTKDIIRGACLNHDNNIAAASGRVTLCEQVCQPGSCCFSQSNSKDGDSVGSGIDSCPSYLPDDYCDKFGSCSVIFTTSLTKREKTQQACSNLSDLSDCVKICARATCCYTKNPWRACAATSAGNMICDDFLSCEILYQGMGTAIDAPKSDRNGNGRRLRAGAPSDII